jgi:hypothetical protein
MKKCSENGADGDSSICNIHAWVALRMYVHEWRPPNEGLEVKDEGWSARM